MSENGVSSPVVHEVANLPTSDLLDSEGKNLKQLVCQRCHSKVLPPKMGTYVQTVYELNLMKKKSDGSGEATDLDRIGQFYRVEDMFDFDNVGFSKSVGDVKFLICADCEIGPIGYFKDNKCYVALARIEHQ